MVRYTSRSIKEALLYAVYIKDEDMKQAMFAQQQKFVKADPRTKTFSWLLVMYWFICAFYWVMAIGRIFTGIGPIDAQGQFSLGLLLQESGR